MLLGESSVHMLEGRYNMYNLRLSIDRLKICMGFSVYTFNVEQRHITYLCATYLCATYLCARAALSRTWAVVMRVGSARLTYEGFLQFVVKGVSFSRKDSGRGSSLIIDLHLCAEKYEYRGMRMRIVDILHWSSACHDGQTWSYPHLQLGNCPCCECCL